MMTWKSTLYDYIYFKNRMEAEPATVEQKQAFMLDSLTEKHWSRAATLSTWYKERYMKPQKVESRLSIVHVNESDLDVQVDIVLRRIFEYKLDGRIHRDGRLEKSRVTLIPAGSKWKIQAVQPLEYERNATQSIVHESVVEESSQAPSLPYVHTGLYSPFVSTVRQRNYNRQKVQEYADKWWDRANPQYIHFDVDCTNYVSQCIFAGDAPMHYTGTRSSGWWYQGKDGQRELWSFSWSVAHSLNAYLSTNKSGLRAEIVEVPEALDVGDVISYDWDGDGRYQHSAIVTAIAADGAPLVNAHTTDSYRRYWDYRDSYAWSERTRYRFLHISDIK